MVVACGIEHGQIWLNWLHNDRCVAVGDILVVMVLVWSVNQVQDR